jgi:hypothetical protein
MGLRLNAANWRATAAPGGFGRRSTRFKGSTAGKTASDAEKAFIQPGSLSLNHDAPPHSSCPKSAKASKAAAAA